MEDLKDLFSELKEKAYDSVYHKYYYKGANQVIRKFFEENYKLSERKPVNKHKDKEKVCDSKEKDCELYNIVGKDACSNCRHNKQT